MMVNIVSHRNAYDFLGIYRTKINSSCKHSQAFLKRPQKLKKNLPLALIKNSCFVKTSGSFFQILWPSLNVLTITTPLPILYRTRKLFLNFG